MKILGLIPARGGSKGVPGKNIRLLGGIPLLGYTANAALNSKLLTKTILTTDDTEIVKIGLQFGLAVPFLRPEHLADDTTPTLPVIQHAIQYLADQGEFFDAVCLLQATSPFRTKDFIDHAILKFIESGTDSLMSVLPVPHEFNPHWTFEPDAAGHLQIATGEKDIIKRRQDLPKCFFRNGSVYITKVEVIAKQNSIYGRSISYVESDNEYHCNIDTLADWEIAEQKALSLNLNHLQNRLTTT